MKTETLDRAAKTAAAIVDKMDAEEISDAARGYLPSQYDKWPEFIRLEIQEAAYAVLDGLAVAQTERSLSHHSNFVWAR